MTVWFPRAIFSLNSFLAAMLAMLIALSMGMVNPFWALMTVYIVSQPQAGSVRSKALYRLMGTGIGGAAAVLFVPHLYNTPELLSLVLAVWVGLCLTISLLDRTPRSYVFMLSGYTAALIAFPGVNTPDAIFDTALARVEEIALGITCATLMHSIMLPQGIAATIEGKVDRFMQDARRWVLDALEGQHDPTSADAHRLAADITDLHILSTHLPFDTSHFQDRSHEVGKLAERMAELLPLASSVGDRLNALTARNATLSPDLVRLVSDIRIWLETSDERPFERADALAARARALEPEPAATPDFDQLLLASLHVRLAELIEAYRDCLALSRHLRGDPDVPAPQLLDSARAHDLHLDIGMAAWSGTTAALAILTVCAGWIATGWEHGGTAAMITAIFMCFFASMDDPARALDSFAFYTALSIPVAAIYLFAILPQMHSFEMLALSLSPLLLGLGILAAIPKWTPRAMPLLLGVAGSLGIQESFSPNFVQFANSSLAMVLGVVASALVTRLIRSVGTDFAARRIMRLTSRDLARLAGEKVVPHAPRWTGRMIDRVGLLGARLAAAGDPDNLVGKSLGEMRVGLNLIALTAPAPAPEDGTEIAALRATLARYFREPARKDDGRILTLIDAALARCCQAPPSPLRRERLLALTGLRRALFPHSLALGASGE